MASSSLFGAIPSSAWQQYPAEESDDWEEESDLETFLAGEFNWTHRDVFDSDTLDAFVEGVMLTRTCTEANLEYKEARDTSNQARRGLGFLASDCPACSR